MITLRKREEMKKYYVKEVNTYVFENDVLFLFDVNVNSNIKAYDIMGGNIKVIDISARNISSDNINACNIKANDIKADDISALNIKANNIDYYAVCFAYVDIECNSIKGRRPNAKHFVLDGELIVKGEQNK